MKQNNYSPREILEINTSFLYFLILTTMAVIAIFFQVISHTSIAGILPAFTVYLIAVIISFFIYRKKKNRRKTSILIWAVGFITMSVPIIAKYNYAANFGWTMSLESYNSSMLIITSLLTYFLLYIRHPYKPP